jgi:hypothetical protein
MSSEEDDSDIGDDEEEEVAIAAAPATKKKRRKTKKKKNKDPNKPKRNMSAFFLYSNAHRARVKEENADAKFGDIVSVYNRILVDFF